MTTDTDSLLGLAGFTIACTLLVRLRQKGLIASEEVHAWIDDAIRPIEKAGYPNLARAARALLEYMLTWKLQDFSPSDPHANIGPPPPFRRQADG